MEVAVADIVGIPNLDDDNGNDRADWEDESIDEDDDVVTVSFVEGTFPRLGNGHSMRFTLRGDRDDIRVWHAGRVVLGNTDEESVREWSVTDEPDLLEVEFADYLVQGRLQVEHVDARGDVVRGTEATLLSSPLIVHNHSHIATHVWAVSGLMGGNDAFIQGYEDALGDRFTAAEGSVYDRDPWMQDELEYASVSAPEDVAMEIVIDSIRDRGLARFAEREIVGAGSARGVWGDPEAVTSQDSFGNLEVTPPVVVDGVSYPYGRVYYGYPGSDPGPDDWWVGTVAEELRDFLADQTVQKPFEVDVGWLCVGHVDEFISWLPDPDAPKGFWMLVADTVSAWELLESMDPSTGLPRYSAADGHGYASVREILEDGLLRSENEELQEERIDPVVEQFIRELGIDEGDIIRVPDLFEPVPGYGGCNAAMIPGMVNMIIANMAEGDDHLFMADPFVRSDLGDQSTDPFIAHMHEILPSWYDLHFLDDWAAYHYGLGEVHCGTNVQRLPAGDWWNTAAHLLTETER